MILSFLDFLDMSFTDVLDILLVGFIIFALFKWIRGSSAMSIFIAIVFLFMLKLLVYALNMKMMNALLDTVLDVGVIALIVIFQPEVRRFLTSLGNRATSVSRSKAGKWLQHLVGRAAVDSLEQESVHEITEACRTMSQGKVGALIVFPHFNTLDEIISTGDVIDAKISRRLILNLFFKNSPLHDGAMIISHNRIVAARCTLPITSRTDIPASYGMRHKAAIGITEDTDAEVIVVSEETGNVTVFKGGEGTLISNYNELLLIMSKSFEEEKENK